MRSIGRSVSEIRVRIKQRKIHVKKYSGYYFPSVSGPTANLVFKTSRESIEIHHWSIPHCGQPQQFNIQHSKLNIALRASVCKRIFVTFALLPPYGQRAYGESRVQNIS